MTDKDHNLSDEEVSNKWCVDCDSYWDDEYLDCPNCYCSKYDGDKE